MRDNWNKIIKEICDEENIDLVELGTDWFLQLVKEGYSPKYIHGYNFGLNSSLIDEICKDKYAMSKLLQSYEIETVNYNIITCADELLDVSEELFKDNDILVCKPNSAHSGKDVYKCDGSKGIPSEIFSKYRSLVLSKYYDIDKEYRAVVLNGEIKLAFVKTPNKGEWRHNLACGADVEVINPKSLPMVIHVWTKYLYEELGLRFASIDFFLDSTVKNRILEINNEVTLNIFAGKSEENYNLAKNVYREAVKSMFSES